MKILARKPGIGTESQRNEIRILGLIERFSQGEYPCDGGIGRQKDSSIY